MKICIGKINMFKINERKQIPQRCFALYFVSKFACVCARACVCVSLHTCVCVSGPVYIS